MSISQNLSLCFSKTCLAGSLQLCGKGLWNSLAAMRCEIMCLMTVVPRGLPHPFLTLPEHSTLPTSPKPLFYTCCSIFTYLLTFFFSSNYYLLIFTPISHNFKTTCLIRIRCHICLYNISEGLSPQCATVIFF